MDKLTNYEINILENWPISISIADNLIWCNNLVNRNILKRYNNSFVLTKIGKKYINPINIKILKNMNKSKFTLTEIYWHESIETL